MGTKCLPYKKDEGYKMTAGDALVGLLLLNASTIMLCTILRMLLSITTDVIYFLSFMYLILGLITLLLTHFLLSYNDDINDIYWILLLSILMFPVIVGIMVMIFVKFFGV